MISDYTVARFLSLGFEQLHYYSSGEHRFTYGQPVEVDDTTEPVAPLLILIREGEPWKTYIFGCEIKNEFHWDRLPFVIQQIKALVSLNNKRK